MSLESGFSLLYFYLIALGQVSLCLKLCLLIFYFKRRCLEELVLYLGASSVIKVLSQVLGQFFSLVDISLTREDAMTIIGG